MKHGALSACLALFAVLTFADLDARPAESASSPIPLDVPGRTDANPWVAASGSFVAVAWGATNNGKTDVFLAVSRDAGATFGSAIRVNETAGEARLGGEFPPRVALVSRRGAALPEIVVLWTARTGTTRIKAARSRDGGKSFNADLTLSTPGAKGDRGWPAVALDQQAGLHAIWLDHRGMAANRTSGADRGSHEHGGERDGVAMARKSGLYYASANRRERQLTSGVCYCCKTAIAAGPDGSLYAAWRHVYPGNLRDIALTMSRDGGRSFSAPVRVNEDGWSINGCPDDGPAIALDAGGGVHLAWPTVITGAKPQGAIFYASTGDGRRFTPPVRIPTFGGPKPSHPQIVVDRGGRIFVAWDEGVNGKRMAAVRELKLRANGDPAFGEVVTLSAGDSATYPVVAATDKGLIAVWMTGGDQSRVWARTIPTP